MTARQATTFLVYKATNEIGRGSKTVPNVDWFDWQESSRSPQKLADRKLEHPRQSRRPEGVTAELPSDAYGGGLLGPQYAHCFKRLPRGKEQIR